MGIYIHELPPPEQDEMIIVTLLPDGSAETIYSTAKRFIKGSFNWTSLESLIKSGKFEESLNRLLQERRETEYLLDFEHRLRKE